MFSVSPGDTFRNTHYWSYNHGLNNQPFQKKG